MARTWGDKGINQKKLPQVDEVQADCLLPTGLGLVRLSVRSGFSKEGSHNLIWES